MTKPRFAAWLVGCLIIAAAAETRADDPARRYKVLVMDSLSLPLSCACVPGVGQRRYEPLVEFVADRAACQLELAYEESLQLAQRRGWDDIEVVIGKRSVVLADAKATGQKLTAVCELTDRYGKTTIQGVVLVAKSSGIEQLQDLEGKLIAIGSEEHVECSSAVSTLLEKSAVDGVLKPHGSIEEAVYAFDDGLAQAVVVSDHLPPMLEGCGKLPKGATKVIARTGESPHVQVFVSESLPVQERERLVEAFIASGKNGEVNRALESKDGLRPIAEDWTDWRGPRRDGKYAGLPKSLDQATEVVWRAELTGPAMAGLSATKGQVFVADKTADFKQDIFRAFDADDGTLTWQVTVDAPDKMDYTNAPRATPVIVGQRVLLQSAFGKLLCVDSSTGKTVWTKHLRQDFDGELPTWGYCVPPLVVEDQVIVAPGGPKSSLVALSVTSGETLWSTPGNAAAYAPFIVGDFGGKRQIIGYDSAGLGGWDVRTGQRLWEMVPPDASDFNVATPVLWRDGVVLATENNGTRYYVFDESGKIVPKPKWENLDCAPDTCTPVVANGGAKERLFCTAYGELFCLDGNGLKTSWSEADERFYDHSCLITGNDRLLIWSNDCDLMLLETTANDFKLLSAMRPMSRDKAESMSHPAIVGDKLFLRSQTELICLRMPSPSVEESSNLSGAEE
ncbi:MAG: PQQ-binding-like beta-propeller repeat protein [Planctomycetota bacterium]